MAVNTIVSSSAHKVCPAVNQRSRAQLHCGTLGCPILYIPMSFNMPDYVKELQARQIKCMEQRAWWPCRPRESTKDTHDSISPIKQPPVLGPCGTSVADTDYLQQEISAAIGEPLQSIAPSLTSAPTCSSLKTSATHPLK
jgi:hypothetical protein